jgi:hypothetical protein
MAKDAPSREDVMEELLRLGLAAALAGVVIAVTAGARRLLARSGKSVRISGAGDLAERYGIADGQAAILYLWEDGCAQCSALQEPVLAAVSSRFDVTVCKLKGAAEPDLLQRFDIATFPSTVVIDRRRAIRGVNAGLTDEATLEAQLA